ncbi:MULTISPECIES: hypothetical protein [Vibrio]|uniref:Uncharacterized protein n=1 Tax=Vibrio diabolicus TaxID=50719 RepID=A0ABN5HIR8_9VIBR|nr:MULTISPECIES: hypothetical protein [Vibrio]MCR9608244.1 hypothetical protein [Vibrio alginolyticus]AVH27046.1 hypothetical protein AL468_07450 [Vibrio diabolicus]MCR9473857.1 hypothetical protein [Vibrio diabolicus]MCR9477712.1 hypothetical protein [Vibrio antiquarius]MCR9611634.1 hypothetical protein [Vibrio alginolyticus]
MTSNYPLSRHQSSKSTGSISTYPLYKSNNQHRDKETIILSIESFDIVVKNKVKDKAKIERWKNIKGMFENSANYYATGQDLVFITNLSNYLYGNNSSVIVKNYSGAPHIILTGSPAMHSKLSGLGKFLPTPTVAKFAVGPEGALQSIRSGGIITIILISTYRVIDFFLNDRQTLAKLFGTLASDIITIGLSSAAAAIFVNFAAAVGGSVVTLSAGPLLGAILISSAVGLLLNRENDKRGLTQKLITSIDIYLKQRDIEAKKRAKEEYNEIQRKTQSMIFSQEIQRGLLR